MRSGETSQAVLNDTLQVLHDIYMQRREELDKLIDSIVENEKKFDISPATLLEKCQESVTLKDIGDCMSQFQLLRDRLDLIELQVVDLVRFLFFVPNGL